MNQRDRLIYILLQSDIEDEHECKLCDKEDYCDLCYFEKLADYLLQNGVIVPPVKVGDTVYVVDERENDVFEGTVTKIEFNYYTIPKEWITVKYGVPCFGMIELDSRMDLLLNKTVFFTREEAEKALKEMEEK